VSSPPAVALPPDSTPKLRDSAIPVRERPAPEPLDIDWDEEDEDPQIDPAEASGEFVSDSEVSFASLMPPPIRARHSARPSGRPTPTRTEVAAPHVPASPLSDSEIRISVEEDDPSSS
jgi:hypothetical protein